ncbi:MAG: hypothetical protein K6T88_18800 [Bacillus sp. (in: Bacteria)]|nr:hypothetical protein [Bacillus sp. (in: firmicutes)]
MKGCEMMGCHKKNEKCKDDCLCRFLRKFKGEEVAINTKSGDIITGELSCVKRCCVKIIEPISMSPPLGSHLTVVRCEEIESFSVVLVGE